MARIHVLLARAAPFALVFRRGPTKQVRQLRWDLRTDELTGGQWLMGRVYQERCALSADGRLLVYFAMRKGEPWTAVSRPGFFTPLAVWEENGTWGGGGVFEHNHRLLLRTSPNALSLQDGFELPPGFELGRLTPEHRTLASSGWTERALDPESGPTPSGAKRPRRFAYPIGRKACPTDPDCFLERHRVEVADPNGPFTAFDYALCDADSAVVTPLGVLDWADWDARGDLLSSEDGSLRRATVSSGALASVEIVASIGDDVFERFPPTAEAKQWPPMRR